MEQTTLLEIQDLSFSYDHKRSIFSQVSFSLKKGEIFTILGSNGAGKSTLLNCVSNLLTPAGGRVLLEGQPIGSIPLRTVAQKVGYVPQMGLSSFSYTVRDYVVMGRAPYLGILNVPGVEEYDRVDAVLEKMSITNLADKIFTQISGGERQQVQIARALVQEPEIILLDEPTNHLDYGNQIKVLKIIHDLAQDGIAVVMTTHMPDHAILLDGTVGILDREGHMTVGPADEIVSEEALQTLYQTDLHLLYIEQLGRVACLAGNLQ